MTIKIIIGLLVLAVGLLWWGRTASEQHQVIESSGEGALISSGGIHWHPTLAIYVRGQQVLVPKNTGLMGGHRPIHTHDEEDGTLHLEFDGEVRTGDITLGEFFNVWGKAFSSTTLMEYENSNTERVRMFVNGTENNEFEAYVLGPEDRIELRFE